MDANKPHEFRFTVFTPTYNRARTLHRVYESLLKQTFRDFEWLIVDDGSVDNTAELVEGWKQAAWFPIRYIRKPNGGKHTAWNMGVDLARGELFISLDSDDACMPEALQTFHDTWEGIDPSRRAIFTGVTALVVDEGGTLSGTRFPQDVLDSNSIEIRLRHKVKGEKWGFHRIEVLRRFPFPEVDGATFIPESTVWFRIALDYQTRYINRVLRTWYQPPKDRSRLTVSPIWINAAGRSLVHLMAINEMEAFLWIDPAFFCRAAANFARTSWHAGAGMASQWRALSNKRARVLWLTMLPVGGLLLLHDRGLRRLDRLLHPQ